MIMIMIDIDMPDNCDECRFNTEYGFCKAMPDNFCGNTDDRKRPEWCPLREQKAVVKQWTKEIADNQLAHAPNDSHEFMSLDEHLENEYKRGIWDGLQIAWNIISEGR